MRTLMIGSLAAVLALSGCANMSETERGTAQGAGIGAGEVRYSAASPAARATSRAVQQSAA